jgi:ribosomal protein L25 (general stress protein Ctc)
MQTHTLSAELRSEKGKNANNKLRSNGFIPAVVYSHGTAESIKIQSKDLYRIFKGHISESVLLNLQFVINRQRIHKGLSARPGDRSGASLDFYK